MGDPHTLRVLLTATPLSDASPTNVAIRARVEKSHCGISHTLQSSSIVISERPLPPELAAQLQLLKDVKVEGGVVHKKLEVDGPTVQILLNQLLQATSSQINVNDKEQLSGIQLHALILEVTADAVTLLVRVVHRPVLTDKHESWFGDSSFSVKKWLPSVCHGHTTEAEIFHHDTKPLCIDYTGPVRLQPGVELLVGEITL